jgi:hypothetical protein
MHLRIAVYLKALRLVKRLSSLFPDGEMVAAKHYRSSRNTVNRKQFHLAHQMKFGLALVQSLQGVTSEELFFFYLNTKIGLKDAGRP